MFDPNQNMFSVNCRYPNVQTNYSVPTIRSSFQNNFSTMPICVPNNYVNNQLFYQNNNFVQGQNADLFRRSFMPQADFNSQYFAAHPSIVRRSVESPSPRSPIIAENIPEVCENQNLGKHRYYTVEQTMLLENVFENYKYLTGRFLEEQREALMKQTGLTKQQLKDWFHNRRMKAKKQGITLDINCKNKLMVGPTESTKCNLGTSSTENNETSIVNTAADETDENPAKKRSRLTYDCEIILQLENTYNRQKYLSRPERAELAAACNLPEQRIRTWFQNRRMKEKKENEKVKQMKNLTDSSQNSACKKIKQELLHNLQTSESADVKNGEPVQMQSQHQNAAYYPTNPNHLQSAVNDNIDICNLYDGFLDRGMNAWPQLAWSNVDFLKNFDF